MVKIIVKIIFLALLIALIPQNLHTQECQNFQTIHPEWVLCEDWETGNIRSDIWNDVSGTNTIISSDPLSGNYALEMTHPAGVSGGYMNSIGYPPQYNGPLGNGYKKLFLRWYTKFSANFSVNSKIAGFDIKPDGLDSFWEDRLGAGYRPNGITSLGGSRVVNGPGPIKFYTYYPYMMLDRWTDSDGNLVCSYYGDTRPLPTDWHIGTPGTEYPDEDYYCEPPGTDIWSEYTTLMNLPYDTYSDDREIGTETWRCIEFEVKVNDAGQINGYQRLYLDNTQVGEWSGIAWTLEDVDGKIRGVQLTASSPADGTHPLMYSYYDNIVVSSSRIGCLGSPVPETEPEPEPDPDLVESLLNSEQTGIIVSGCGLAQSDWHVSHSIIVILLAALTLLVMERGKGKK